MKKAYSDPELYFCIECGADMTEEVEGPETELECNACRAKREESDDD